MSKFASNQCKSIQHRRTTPHQYAYPEHWLHDVKSSLGDRCHNLETLFPSTEGCSDKRWPQGLYSILAHAKESPSHRRVAVTGRPGGSRSLL
jgi:hypothetical protein